MTTVIGFFDKETGATALAADSAITGEFKVRLKSSKIFLAGKDLAIGVFGIVPPPIEYPDLPPTREGAEELARLFVAAQVAAGHGTQLGDEGIQVYPSGGIIVGASCGPFFLTPTGEIYEGEEGYMAGGSGAGLAMGTLASYVLYTKKNPDKRIPIRTLMNLALETSALHDPHTGLPGSMVVWSPRKTKAG